MAIDFERLFEASPALYLVLAPDPPRFTIVAASDAYLAAVKKQRDASFIGRPVFEALPPSPEDRSSEVNSRASFQRVFDLKAPDTMAVQRHDIVRPAAEGGGYETRYWSPVNTPVLGEGGEVLYILHRVEDVTELVTLEERGAELRDRAGRMELEVYRRAQEIQDVNRQLREANARLGELDQAKTVFFSTISHELRTPLTLMLGTLEQLLSEGGGPPRDALEMAHRNAVRLLKLVNGLLEFTRVEAGRAEPTFRPTDVGTLTAALASGFASACERAGVRLAVDCPPLEGVAWVDRDAWERIVLNLVSNAFKFTLAGEIAVRVGVREDALELSVRDTGVGIPEEELPKVFERFHRVPGTQGRTLEGSGIGLSLVRELVAMHRGIVRVESRLGRGSTFTVTIPLGTAHLPAGRLGPAGAPEPTPRAARPFVEESLGWVAEPATPAAEGARAEAPRARVLVADDNADMRAHLTRLLSPRFEVVAAADGQAALEVARRARPDLVLTDVMMPRLDGFGLLRALRTDPGLATVPVVMLSARAGDEASGEGLEAGADDYLVKPFSARELLARVTTHLALVRVREEAARARAREVALEEVDRRKDAFLAMLSHELRNPLAPIRNSLYVLERTPAGGEQARRAHGTLDRQVTHLTRMVEDLLDVSRIVQGKLRLQEERVELDEVVRGAAEDARAAFEQAGVQLEVDVSPAPLAMRGDPTRLAQVIGNLLVNAARFTPRGGHTRLSLHAEGDDTALLTVRDDGAGLPPGLADSLFEPFVQAPQAIDRRAGGLGLGLAVVRGIVELHGGTVRAHSEGRGQGTEVTVRLPLAEPPRAHLAIVSAPGPRPVRVLVIEDNPDAAQSLAEALELGGHEVVVAGDGLAGLALARDARPEAIVCDIGLPELDGYGVASAIRADPALRSACLVALTGYAALDDRERSLAAGFDHHMAKPPDLAALEELLGRCAAVAASRAS